MLYELSWLASTLVLSTLLVCSVRFLGKEALPALFGGTLVLAIFIAGKLGSLPIGDGFAISASIFIYSTTFLITDVASELYGKKFARKIVLGSALCYPLLILTTQFSIPWEPSIFYEGQEAFVAVMGTATRVMIASILGFLSSQTVDVTVFHWIKGLTGEKMLWLRNNGSTWVSQAVDTVVFYTVAFGGTLPTTNLLYLIGVTYIIKLLIALADTPFVYLSVWFIGRPGKSDANPDT